MTRLRPNDPCWCGSGKKYKKCHEPMDRLAALGGGSAGAARAAAVGPGVAGAVTAFKPVRKGIVGPRRSLPERIVPPDYAKTGRPGGGKGLRNIKSGDQLERMRTACRLAREVLDVTVAAVEPGITTDALDAIAHAACIERDCYPSPLNYLNYPKSICTSVNEVICHGIPDSRPLEDGDIVNVDVTVYHDGMHGDNSAMVLVGDVDAEGQRLVEATRDCLMAGIEAVRPGAKLCDIGRAIDRVADDHQFSVVRAFVGHGIGELFHMEPQVAHYYDPKNTTELVEGMTFTIEPMINVGVHSHSLWDDDWTAVTADLKRSAQWEHTVLVTAGGVEILTLASGEPQPFPH